MRRIAVIPLVVLALSACDEGKATTPPNQQRQVSAAQLAGAMIDSYQGLKVTENDAQDHYQRLEDRLLAGLSVTERSVPLGDAGRIVDVEMSGGQEQRRGASTVVFAHRGVLAIIVAPRGDFGTFPEQALKRMQEKL